MNKNYLIVPALAVSSFFSSGCVGTGPNTQQGAVTGGALGALAGAVIGNNSGGNSLGGAAIGAALGAIAGGTMGNSVDHERDTLYGQSPAPRYRYRTASRPPTPPPPPVTPEPFSAPPASNASARRDGGVRALARRALSCGCVSDCRLLVRFTNAAGSWASPACLGSRSPAFRSSR